MSRKIPAVMAPLLRVVGLMSGTALDGVDAAMIDTDGQDIIKPGPALTLPYPPEFRARVQGILGSTAPSVEIAAVESVLTHYHADAVRALIDENAIAPIHLIGFHGHTILHQPQGGPVDPQRRTWQIGSGALLASLLSVPVISDFRSADVAAGGEGAPLVPAYHAALAANLEKPLAVVNIGGVANVTWIGDSVETCLAFDTGPGNALIDDWALQHTGIPMDRDGVLAQGGRVDHAFVQQFLRHPYFGRSAPKSLDRNDFASMVPRHLSPADGARTLVQMTVASIAAARSLFPAPPRRWLVTGGGRHNPVLMAALRLSLAKPVDPVEAVGWNGDALEAQAFAYLAVRSRRGLPLSYPGTTGVPAPQIGGRVDEPTAEF